MQRRGALRPGGSTKNRTVVKNDSIAETVSEDDHGEGRRWEGGKGRDGEEREGGREEVRRWEGDGEGKKGE